MSSGQSSAQGGRLVDADHPVTFSFEGRTITALPGQSIAAALYAAGMRIFTRSFKYHRPRGLFCVAGDCPNCLMQVDGRPNVRTCIEAARQGQVVVHQNAWPSLKLDVLRSFDWLDRFLPVGFYYKRFHKPRWLWPIFEHVVRHIAGLGRIDVHAEPAPPAGVEHIHTDVCVVGAGPAGLAAAETAAHAGARVLLLDRQPRAGGHLLFDAASLAELDKSLAALTSQPRLDLWLNTSVFGLYEGNLLGAFQGDRFLKIRARQVVVCTGGRQRPYLFHNNDLPGIFLGQGVLRLGRLYGVPAGKRAVVLTDNDRGYRLVRQLQELGIEVAAVVDPRAEAPAAAMAGVTVHSGRTVTAAVGRKHLRAVQIALSDGGGSVKVEQIRCDLLCLASELTPANELLLQRGMRYRSQNGRWLPDRTLAGLWATGAVAGQLDLAGQLADGRRCGAAAAAALGLPLLRDFAFSALDLAGEMDGGHQNGTSTGFRGPQPSPGSQRKSFVCLCEDVTEKDIHQAVVEGFDHIETLKRYATVSMGPCQGKMCGLTANAVCAWATGRDVNAVGITTSRPPAIPVEMRVLAAERRHAPLRRTPLHHWHQSAGARWLDAGAWKRPESYGNVQAEVQAVRTKAGLIDVSTLGKIELRGPDAAELLERIYLNAWKDLKVGRARYGVMCTDEGIVFDDGVGARLGPEQFYLTATTGNADVVFQWLERWRAEWRLDVDVANRTAAMAAMNLAGPAARDILASLTELDVSLGGFPYMAVREGPVAGVPCRVLRIGFVGELGYEIHCPSSQAWFLWNALLTAGSGHHLKPFGVEAQRVLRLEKGHVIVGQDTDALSNPLDAELGWLIKFDKQHFHGKEPLLRLRAMGKRAHLAGFYFVDERALNHPWDEMREFEGCQVIDEGAPVGRVTSCRYSPTLDRCLGLAWVPPQRSKPGSRFLIRWHNRDILAEVSRVPFYDPEGKRLKS
jgi:sarcosine oxidase subunit alpha